jgi:multicomponent Na+:H+ antiporter subunit E
MLWNIVLALLWMLITNLFSAANLVVGLAVGLAILATFGSPLGGAAYARRLWRIVGLLVFFLKEMLVANLKMAYFTLMPLSRIRPGIVAVPLEPMSEGALTLLANLITLTPGTLSVEVSADRRVLYVHSMEVDDPEAVSRDVKRGFEARVLEIVR